MPTFTIQVVDCLILGVLQIMTSSFHILMWIFLLNVYNFQQKKYFGVYNPITYKVHYPSWAFSFLMSGILLISEVKFSSIYLKRTSLLANIVSLSAALVGIILIFLELHLEVTVSYKNFSKAILGRIVSSILLITTFLEFSLTCTYICHLLCNWDSLVEESSVVLSSRHDTREVDNVKVEEEKAEEEPMGEETTTKISI